MLLLRLPTKDEEAQASPLEARPPEHQRFLAVRGARLFFFCRCVFGWVRARIASSPFRSAHNLCAQRAATLAQYAKDVRDGKKSRRTPWSEFKTENSLTPTLTPAVRQLRKRPSSKEDIVAILVERGIEHKLLGNFQDLKKLIPIDAAGFMIPWAGLPGDVHAPADALEDAYSSADALEDAHAAADLEEEAIVPDAAAHPGGRPKRARHQNRFFGDDRSSDSSS